MHEIGLDGDLINWVGSFLSERRPQLVIDGHCGTERQVVSGILLRSPVSPILFTIYLSGVFHVVEVAVPRCQTTSFADACWFVVEAPGVRELAEMVGKVGNRAIQWGEENGLLFDHAKTEALAFTRRRKQMPQIVHAKMVIKGRVFVSNRETPRWLGM